MPFQEAKKVKTFQKENPSSSLGFRVSGLRFGIDRFPVRDALGGEFPDLDALVVARDRDAAHQSERVRRENGTLLNS